MVDKLIERATLQYMELYGRTESISIIEKLNSSKLFNDNINISTQKQIVLNGKAINAIIFSSHYKFLLAHKRKIQFGSLFFLQIIYKKFEHMGIPIDDEKFVNSFLEICDNFSKSY